MENEIDIQRRYYTETAGKYNAMHGDEVPHVFAMHIMFGLLDYLGVKSVLDVGAGTGRILKHAMNNYPDLFIMGIEPVKELREIAYREGVSRGKLIEADAMALPFTDDSFDVVCIYAVLHHIRCPDVVVKEMLRVARKAIFISDSNNFGQGALMVRYIKQAINLLGLWGFANFIKTRGRGYLITEGDGISYSYSVFNNYSQVCKSCTNVHLFNTSSSGGVNPYRSAGSVALLGIIK